MTHRQQTKKSEVKRDEMVLSLEWSVIYQMFLYYNWQWSCFLPLVPVCAHSYSCFFAFVLLNKKLPIMKEFCVTGFCEIFKNRSALKHVGPTYSSTNRYFWLIKCLRVRWKRAMIVTKLQIIFTQLFNFHFQLLLADWFGVIDVRFSSYQLFFQQQQAAVFSEKVLMHDDFHLTNRKQTK